MPDGDHAEVEQFAVALAAPRARVEAAGQEALAHGPRDAFASVLALEDDGPASSARAFAGTLVTMCRSRARTRGMRWTDLDGASRDGEPGRMVAALLITGHGELVAPAGQPHAPCVQADARASMLGLSCAMF